MLAAELANRISRPKPARQAAGLKPVAIGVIVAAAWAGAQNALARPSNLGASDLQTLKKELAGTAEGDAVMHLVQQAQMADLVRKSGTAKGDQLVGGLSSGLGRVFSSGGPP